MLIAPFRYSTVHMFMLISISGLDTVVRTSLAAVVLVLVARVSGQTCSDIDTDACKVLQASQADMCATTLGNHACPHYCNLCGMDTVHFFHKHLKNVHGVTV